MIFITLEAIESQKKKYIFKLNLSKSLKLVQNHICILSFKFKEI